MKKVILSLICIIGSCLFSPMHAQVENASIRTDEVSSALFVQPGFVVGMTGWTSDLVEYLVLWTQEFFNGDPVVEGWNIRFDSGIALVTVAIRDVYRDKIDLVEYRLGYCLWIDYMARQFGGHIIFEGISLDL